MTVGFAKRGVAYALMMLVLAACTPQADDAAPAASPRAAPPGETVAQDGTERAVVAETLAYAEVDKKLVKGHFAFPEDMVEPLPAVIMIHEWWGLTPSARALADRLASEGFIVLAVDLFDGATAENAPDARKLMLGVVEKPENAEQNIARAFEWLLETTEAPSIATVGFGFGGGWSLHAAGVLPDKLSATVIYYGQVSDNEDSLAAINAPLLGFFGTSDTAVPEQTVNDFEAVLEKLEKNYVIEMYAGVKGGFADPESRNFNDKLASTTWAQMLDFLREHLPEDQAQ